MLKCVNIVYRYSIKRTSQYHIPACVVSVLLTNKIKNVGSTEQTVFDITANQTI